MTASAINTQIELLNNGLTLDMAKRSASQLINEYGQEIYAFRAIVASHIEAATKSRTKSQFKKHMKRALEIQQQEEMGVIAV